MINSKTKKDDKPVVASKVGALSVCALFFVTLTLLFLVSVFDEDKTVSQRENRNLSSFPDLCVVSLFNGSFSKNFDEYYADTFPMRDKLLIVNEKISKVFSKTGAGDDSMVIVEKQDKGDFSGQNITYGE